MNNGAHRNRARGAACERDNAKCTAVVTALLHPDKGPAAAVEARHQMARQLLHRHDVVNQDLAIHGRHEVGPVQLFPVAQNPIHLVHGGECARLQLRRATGYHDGGAGLLPPCLADGLPSLAHRFGCDGAGVDDDCVLQAGIMGLIAHHFRLIGIQAAAKINDPIVRRTILAAIHATDCR